MHQNNFINPKIKDHYNRYCAISRKVIREAKKLQCNSPITFSVNKIEGAWSVIKQESDKIQVFDNISSLSWESGKLNEAEEIAYTFNKLVFQ
jgi:predicted metalloprotease